MGLVPQDLMSGLLEAQAYPHAAEPIELIETHISWVLLAGDYVYKIKKPLKLAFLDFSDLDRRKFYCEEEIRLNKPWAPEIYLRVVPITMQDSRPRIGGEGEPVEYAVMMARFDQSLRLDRQLLSGRLSVADMRELAANIAHRHASAAVVTEAERQRCLELTESLIQDNFTELKTTVADDMLTSMHDWTERQLQALRPFISERFDSGFYRDCHGDLHLANLVRLTSGITSFDCAEFSVDLRHIDVACDIAFLVMDLESRDRDDLAAHFLNRYLEKTGDYGSLRLFDLYFVYRCLVRAKVAAIRGAERCEGESRQQDLIEVERYCGMASRQIENRMPTLILMHGLSGSGKTWASETLMAQLPAIRIRSDIERKRLFGFAEAEQSGSAVAGGIYESGASELVYELMHEHAAAILRSGHNVILDAAFLKQSQRDEASCLAHECGARFLIVETTAPVTELRRRIAARERQGKDASEADFAVLDYQLQNAEWLSDAERVKSITVDSGEGGSVAALAGKIRRLVLRSR